MFPCFLGCAKFHLCSSLGKAKAADALSHKLILRADVTHDQDFGTSTQRVLQDLSELGVAVRDMCARGLQGSDDIS